MFTVGAIINTHGVKGEAKVKRTGDFTERFDVGNKLYYKDQTNDLHTLTIETSRMQGEIHLLSFVGLDSMDAIIPLKGTTLYIKEEQLTDLGENEYYYHEIIGCTVTTDDGIILGKIDSILSPGANDVWIVKSAEGKEYLIPYIADVVKKVDVQEKCVTITLMEGLID